MPEFLEHHPGLLYVVATLLPLASFLFLLLLGGVRNYLRKSPEGSLGETVFKALGGEKPTRGAAYVATAAIAGAFVLSLIGFLWYSGGHAEHEQRLDALKARVVKFSDRLHHFGEEKELSPQER